MRLGYFGPEGTFTHEALLAAHPSPDHDLVPFPTVHHTVLAVHDGEVDRALVPIENALEGSVNETLDALAVDAADVVIVGERVESITHCLIARAELPLEAVEAVVSHPQPNAQCARFLRTHLAGARVLPAISTSDAVRQVAEHDGPWAALGTRLAAQLHGCVVLREGVEDEPGNVTRFAWIAPRGTESGPPAGAVDGAQAWKTSVVFWGAGDDTPGWLVRCLSEFAFRGVNLTLIESRPRKLGLGHYMFFADVEGREDDEALRLALAAVAKQTETLRVLGSYPAA